MSLRALIADEVRRRGPIPFSRYMELCLYHPDFGYYQRPQEKFGKGGDFYTSSDVHALFGRLLARQFEEMWRALDSPARLHWIEAGPGRGLFACDLLDWSQRSFPEFYSALRCTLVESSPALRARLERNLEPHLRAAKAAVAGELPPPGGGEAVIVFANEFFDALPVEIVSARGEVRVTVEDGRFREHFAPPPRPTLDYLDRYGIHPGEDERVEAPLAAQEWMTRLAAAVPRGFAVIVDYGYTREQQLAGRHRDTLMTYCRHTPGADPYLAPGEQDITAHVNFTALRAAAESAGMRTLALLTQAQFLMGIGQVNEFADAFAGCRLPQERAKVALQLKHLVTPAGLGETFQVLLLARGVEKEKAARLSGLAFAR